MKQSNRPGRSMRAAILLQVLALAGSTASPAGAAVLLTQAEALRLAFGEGAAHETKTAFLTDEQMAEVEEAAGSRPSTAIVIYYVSKTSDPAPRAAFFDTHLVRTKPETVMIVIGADGKVSRVDVISFDEPRDYLPGARWMEQFGGRALDAELRPGRGIRAVSGATLSSRSITAATRRALALHRLLVPAPEESTEDSR